MAVRACYHALINPDRHMTLYFHTINCSGKQQIMWMLWFTPSWEGYRLAGSFQLFSHTPHKWRSEWDACCSLSSIWPAQPRSRNQINTKVRKNYRENWIGEETKNLQRGEHQWNCCIWCLEDGCYNPPVCKLQPGWSSANPIFKENHH